jgi:hypothetical protein
MDTYMPWKREAVAEMIGPGHDAVGIVVSLRTGDSGRDPADLSMAAIAFH